MALVPPPPRLSGDYQSDQITLADWISDFYQGTTNLDSPTINPNNLPSPGSSSIADAQLTANRAYQFCIELNAALAAVNADLSAAITAINKQLGTAAVTGFPLSITSVPVAGIPVTEPT